MKRRAFDIFASVSALLLGLTAVFWCLSYLNFATASHDGRLFILLAFGEAGYDPRYGKPELMELRDGFAREATSHWSHAGLEFHYGQSQWVDPGPTFWRFHTGSLL